jgi:hypothetical protein
MIRDDGSIRSAHIPSWNKPYQVRDYGLYRGVVREVIYLDHENNDSGVGTPNEVVYTVMIVGGDRDGQIFSNARLIRGLGGFSNFEEVTLKAVEGATKSDPTSILAAGDPTISFTPTFNGDVIYIQFLDGDLNMPVITGLGYHQKAEPEATSSDGPRYRRKFNGVYTQISKDGEFTWSKDNGSFVPVLTNPKDPLYPFISQFAPLPGQEEAIKVSLDNQYNLKLEFLPGLNAAISGLEDQLAFNTALGTKVSIIGKSTDSVLLATAIGTAVNIEGGSKDSITLTTNTGATAALANGEVKLESAGKAGLTLTKEGFVKLGNSSVDVIKDILQELIKSLATATYSGFGAPGSNVADLAQLLGKLQPITGG